jgi:hypothetical protein
VKAHYPALFIFGPPKEVVPVLCKYQKPTRQEQHEILKKWCYKMCRCTRLQGMAF